PGYSPASSSTRRCSASSPDRTTATRRASRGACRLQRFSSAPPPLSAAGRACRPRRHRPNRREADRHREVPEPLRLRASAAHGVENESAPEAQEREDCDRGGEQCGRQPRDEMRAHELEDHGYPERDRDESGDHSQDRKKSERLLLLYEIENRPQDPEPIAIRAEFARRAARSLAILD